LTICTALVCAAAASADVLISMPQQFMGCAQAIRLGVWYQSYSGGPRWYSVSVFRPDGHRVFYRSGLATTTWRYFGYRPISDPDVPLGMSTYRVVYGGGHTKTVFRVRVECGE
jgi:hypothetical protein